MGGIQSFVKATKDEQEIIIIGHTRVNTWHLGAFTIGDEQAKQILFPQLDMWSRANKEITFISMDSESTWKDHSTRVANTKNEYLEMYKPLHGVINAVAHANNAKYGNISFVGIREDACFEATNWSPLMVFSYEFFPAIAEEIELMHDKQTGKIVNRIEDFQSSLDELSPRQQKQFFSKKGRFNNFISCATEVLKEHAQLITVKEYYTYLQEITKQTTLLIEEPKLKEQAKNLLLRLEHTPLNVAAFLAPYGITNDKTLLEALYTIIKAERQISDTCVAFFQDFLVPIQDYQHLAMLNTLTTYKRAVITLPHGQVAEAASFLKEADYKVISKGHFPRAHVNSKNIHGLTPFSEKKIQTLLNSCFEGTTTEQIEKSPFEEYTTYSEEQKKLALKIKQLTQSTEKKFTPLTPSPIRHTCKICKSIVHKHTAYLFFKKNKKCLCSLQCYTADLIAQKTPKLNAFLTKESYTAKENRTLKYMAALCYLRYRTLSPMITLNEGSIFHSKLKASLPQLQEIIKKGPQDPAWQKALTLLTPLYIHHQQIVAFLNLWQVLKVNYIKACKNHTNTKVEPPVFDPDEQLSKHVANQRKQLNKICSSPQYSSRIYYALLETLRKKTDFNPKHLSQALKLTLPGKSVDQLLKELN